MFLLSIIVTLAYFDAAKVGAVIKRKRKKQELANQLNSQKKYNESFTFREE